MTKLLLIVLFSLLSFSLIQDEAFAKRFGGGRSFGVQRPPSSLSRSYSPQNTASLAQKANPSRWGGFLGGALLGGLLATLFMGNGLIKGLLTWLLIGAAILFVIGLFRRKMQPGYSGFQSSAKESLFNNFTKTDSVPSSNGNFSEHPANFNKEAFIRQAKVTFLRLQAAYDDKNLSDLKTFTAPEVYGEIKMQLDERGNEANKTEVIDLHADLLDVSEQTLSLMASVRFTGSIKENEEPLTNLDEIWHFRQFPNDPTWVVAGIQQEIYQP